MPRTATAFLPALVICALLLKLTQSHSAIGDLDIDIKLFKVVTPKRSTMLLNKLIYGFKKAVLEEDEVSHQMEHQRHGHQFWRCYFNAVSCFRRK
ncbi:uncharacterized protein LOC143228294 [Tachypleus tridentatus]|uniref:uncharacterized protein LOC143228294 n=1 Tax=Tachypleus tridentatus TaxID=6853 RepID=UPI003FD0282D